MTPGHRSEPTHRRLRRLLNFTAVALVALAAGTLSVGASSGATAPTPMTAQAWHSTMATLATPSAGCFDASYPTAVWHGTACTTAPRLHFTPKLGAGTTTTAKRTISVGPEIVGNGVDYSAQVTGVLNSATGSFPSVIGVTSVSSLSVANAYSIQLNSSYFTTSVCTGHGAGCRGWEQFLFSNPGSGPSSAFIESWLLNWTGTCPVGWTLWGGTNCYINSAAVAVPSQPITSLGSLSLTGAATATTDTVTMQTGAGAYSVTAPDSMLDLSANWNTVEFMIGGDGNASEAVFNAGSTVTVQTVTHNGTTTAPTCVYEGFTGETNSLNLSYTPTWPVSLYPTMQSIQTSTVGTPSCASAHGLRDTHLLTFGGTGYDFQADGSYVMARNANMTIENNQVSGAPEGWSGAAVNSAVAAQMGSDTVALCAADQSMLVDGTEVSLASGSTLGLTSGDRVTRTGNSYVVTDPQGDSMTANMETAGLGNYIDLYVGLGTYPEPVVGLLANAPGNNNALATSTGTVIPIPLSFSQMYQQLGNSWGVPASAALTAACPDEGQAADPSAPLWENTLPAQQEAQAKAVCQGEKITNQNLLEDCTLDTAVMGDEAAPVYAGMAPPLNVAFSEDTAGGGTKQGPRHSLLHLPTLLNP
jgi:von Willebrand factor type D domain